MTTLRQLYTTIYYLAGMPGLILANFTDQMEKNNHRISGLEKDLVLQRRLTSQLVATVEILTAEVGFSL